MIKQRLNRGHFFFFIVCLVLKALWEALSGKPTFFSYSKRPRTAITSEYSVAWLIISVRSLWVAEQFSCLDRIKGPGFESCWRWNSAPTVWPFIAQSPSLSEPSIISIWLNPSLAEHDMPCLSKQCRSRSVGFWRSQLIWICTVCH